MMQRLRDALRRGRFTEPPDRQYRPNEFRVDTARADRMRHEVRRPAPAHRLPVRSLEEQRARGPREELPALDTQPRSVPRMISALKTRSGLRQAWLLKEILGPPLAMRNSSSDDSDG
jgi:hypothetical protein